MVPPKEQYVTKQEFKEYKDEVSIIHKRNHDKYNEITKIMAKRDVFEVFIDKFDKLCTDFNTFMIKYATESERQSNLKREVDELKHSVASKADLETILTETKSQKWLFAVVGGAVGVVISIILLAILGTYLPT